MAIEKYSDFVAELFAYSDNLTEYMLKLVLENESNVITLNLPEMGINPEHYEAVEKVCKEIESRGIELRIIK